MKPWVAFALVSMFFAGITSVIAKMGLEGISAELGLAVRTCFVFGFVLIFASLTVPLSEVSRLTWPNYGWLLLSAATTTISWIFYYKAIHDGRVSTVALIDKGSVVVAVVLACFILKEQITWRTIVGGAFMVGGLLLVARK